jgi:integrase
MEREHCVPLSSAALMVLRSLPRTNGPYLFAGIEPGAPLGAKRMIKVLEAAGYDATVHGMRSSFANWCAEKGYANDAIDIALAHIFGKTKRTYQRTDLLDVRRTMMEKWGEFCVPAASDNVVPMIRA